MLSSLFLQRLVEAAEEAHLQHEENPDLQVSQKMHFFYVSQYCLNANLISISMLIPYS